MDKSVDYQKAIAEAKESIQMLVNEYRQTTMSPTLLGRSYYEEKHRPEEEKVEERSLEEIRKEIQSLVEEYRPITSPVAKKEDPIETAPVADAIRKKKDAIDPQIASSLIQKGNKPAAWKNETSKKEKNTSVMAPSSKRLIMRQKQICLDAEALNTPQIKDKVDEQNWSKDDELRRKEVEDLARILKKEAEKKERLVQAYEKASVDSNLVKQNFQKTSVYKHKEKQLISEHIESNLNPFSPDIHKSTDKPILKRNGPISNIRKSQNNKKTMLNAEITAHDFVVRLDIFKCRNKGHHIQDIQATFTTINRLGNVTKIKAPAGYCPDCKMYFIMDNIYQRIKHSGIPICRTMDEKSFISTASLGRSAMSPYGHLAQESVLKQFGTM